MLVTFSMKQKNILAHCCRQVYENIEEKKGEEKKRSENPIKGTSV